MKMFLAVIGCFCCVSLEAMSEEYRNGLQIPSEYIARIHDFAVRVNTMETERLAR